MALNGTNVNQVIALEVGVPRGEHPSPQWKRANWQSLNGTWEFAFDDERQGVQEKWQMDGEFPLIIQVPFSFESTLSGIGDRQRHDVVWYRRRFPSSPSWVNHRVWLHFGAVDYRATVWVNGQVVTTHEGGHTPFSCDVADFLSDEDNTLVVMAEDFTEDLSLPRGKQYWKDQSESIFYTRTTGIWQSVWLEILPIEHIQSMTCTADLDAEAIDLNVDLEIAAEAPVTAQLELELEIRFDGALVESVRIPARRQIAQRLYVGGKDREVYHWSPDHPNLYDLNLRLLNNGELVDEVESYFGMRRFEVINGRILLNNRPYFLRLVLDQGYFPDGNLTPPSDEAIRHDVELTKALGFNGARKHQKVEDPRYLYWCDKIGLLVWGEMSNAYEFSSISVQRLAREWTEAILRDRNHPCIVAWVPLNESWGAPNLLHDQRQRAFLTAMYHLTKALDSTRPVISNDGWEHTRSDLCTIHDYECDRDVLAARYRDCDTALRATPGGKLIYAPTYHYEGEPIVISEMGGISFRVSEQEGWGYSAAVSEVDFLDRYRAVVEPMYTSPVVQGFCYTQLTDVEQEINGLLTYERIPKADIEALRRITTGEFLRKGEA